MESVANADPLPPASVPPCHIGCTESLLGLLNTQQEKGLDDLLKVFKFRRSSFLTVLEVSLLNLICASNT